MTEFKINLKIKKAKTKLVFTPNELVIVNGISEALGGDSNNSIVKVSSKPFLKENIEIIPSFSNGSFVKTTIYEFENYVPIIAIVSMPLMNMQFETEILVNPENVLKS